MMNIKKNKLKILPIAFCCLVISLYSDAQSMEEDSYELDNTKKHHLRISFENNGSLQTEYKTHKREADLFEYVPLFQYPSFFFQGSSLIMSGIAVLSQESKFKFRGISPRIGLCCSIGALCSLTIDNAIIKPIISRLNNAPANLDGFINKKSKMFAEELNIKNPRYVRILLEKYLTGGYDNVPEKTP